jgi:BirA family transcriptional regulator, biotin operon repressor / biotin---[acetyl-CoA-carboxylase] ligase
VAGVLCEAAWEGESARFVIAGVGVNVLQGAGDFTEEIRPVATSLAAASGRVPDRLEVAGALAAALSGLSGLDAPRLTTAELDALSAVDALRGHQVSVEDGAEPLEGTALGIAPGGALLVRGAAGRLHEVITGSVRLAGAARGG